MMNCELESGLRSWIPSACRCELVQIPTLHVEWLPELELSQCRVECPNWILYDGAVSSKGPENSTVHGYPELYVWEEQQTVLRATSASRHLSPAVYCGERKIRHPRSCVCA